MGSFSRGRLLETSIFPQDGAPRPHYGLLSTGYQPSIGHPAQRLSRQRFSALALLHRCRPPAAMSENGVTFSVGKSLPARGKLTHNRPRACCALWRSNARASEVYRDFTSSGSGFAPIALTLTLVPGPPLGW